MLYRYKVITPDGKEQTGKIDAASSDFAVTALQRRGFAVVSVQEVGKKTGFSKSISLTNKVPLKEIVIFSRQIATLFEAQVSAVKAFNLLSENVKSEILQNTLRSVSADLQGGMSISDAMAKHPKAFSSFYVNMVAAGEESGRLSEIFSEMASYMERTYALVTKTKNALIYPAFVIVAFIGVMSLILTVIIPRLSVIIKESGADIPLYTQAVLGLSDFLVNYGVFVLAALAIGSGLLFQFSRTASGKKKLDNVKLTIPFVGNLYRKLYLSRITDNIDTMLASGIAVIRSLEITKDIIDNRIYKSILDEAIADVKGGTFISEAFAKHQEFPVILVQMLRVGEETGKMGSVLGTLGKFYRKEVEDSVDNLIGLIEPAMIILLGVGVGFLITSVLVPIYNITAAAGV